MGQVCCVPRRRTAKQIAKIKAEARSATASRQGAEIPQAIPPMTDRPADVLHSGGIRYQNWETTTHDTTQPGAQDRADSPPNTPQEQFRTQAPLQDPPPRDILSPIPQASSWRFPFMYHTSGDSTYSSRRNSLQTGDEGTNGNDQAQPGITEPADEVRASDTSSTASVETVVARRLSADHDDDTADAGSIRYSFESINPDIFFIAPSSPKARPSTPVSTPTVKVTLATPSSLTLQAQSIRPSIVDHSLLNAEPDPESQRSPPLLPIRSRPPRGSQRHAS